MPAALVFTEYYMCRRCYLHTTTFTVHRDVGNNLGTRLHQRAAMQPSSSQAPAVAFDLADSPSSAIAVAATLLALLLAALALDRFARRARLPGTLKSSGRIPLSAEEVFGDAGAQGRLRDLAHVLEHGEVRLLRTPDAVVTEVPPPPSHGKRQLQVKGSAHEAELRAYLIDWLTSDGFDTAAHACAVNRLADMLSLTLPAAVLRSAGCPPTLRNHRFLVVHGDGLLRTLATGHIEANRGSGARTNATELRLTIVSPNLVKCGECAASSCHVEYTVVRRSAAATTIDEEVRRAATAWAAGRF